MQVVASAGLANHFSAIRSLITTGIQKGHMKMHLSNILHGLNVTDAERKLALEHFKGKTVSYSEAREFIEIQRQQK